MSVRKHESKFECLLLRMQYFEIWICTDVTKKENLKLSSSFVTFKSQLFSPFTKLSLLFCCYNCLDLPSVSYSFSKFLRAGTVLRKGCASSCDLFKTLFLLERTGKTSNQP